MGYTVPGLALGASGLLLVHDDPEGKLRCDGLTIDHSTQADGVVVRLQGELDAHNAPEVGATLADIIDHSTGNVEVDVEEVAFVDSAGVRVLLELSRGMDALQRRLSLVHPSPIFTRIIGLLDVGDDAAGDASGSPAARPQSDTLAAGVRALLPPCRRPPVRVVH